MSRTTLAETLPVDGYDPSPAVGGDIAKLHLVRSRDEAPFLIDNPAQVARVKYGKDQIEDHGSLTTHHYDYTMSDGFAYHAVETVPSRPASDTAIGMISPWFTRPDLGLMRDLSHRLASIGYPVIIVGGEGSAAADHVPLLDQIKALGHITLSASTVNGEAILSDIIGKRDYRPGLINLGYSKGQMAGIGIRNVLYGHYIDGCYYSRAPSPSLVDLMTRVVPPELPTAASFVKGGMLHPSYLLSGAKSPRELAHQIMTWPALSSGEAAAILSRSNPDTPTLVTLMNESRASCNEAIANLLKGRTDTAIEYVSGTHLSIAKEFMTRSIVMEMETLREARGSDGDFNGIDYDAIRAVHASFLGDKLVKFIKL